MMKLDKAQLPALLDFLAKQADVYAPIAEDGMVILKKWQGGTVAEQYINPENSLKDVLYPQTDSILEFEGGFDDMEIQPAPSPKAQVVFGTRPCDAAALAKTARVFTEGEFADENYLALRAATTIITVACERSGPVCFCRAMEVSPADRRGSDVVAYPDGSDLYLEAVTEKGEQLLSEVDQFLSEGSAEKGEAARSRCEATEVANATAHREPLTQEFFENPYWEALSARCLSCGICTYVCPTCYCFSIFDAVRGTKGKRMRGWDSCQFEAFATMAGGHNPRPSVKERVRQRFMHKLAYFPEKYGELHCVGCGRCVAKCPVGLHILGVITDLEEVV